MALPDLSCNCLILLLSGSVNGEMSDPSGKIVKVDDIEAPAPLTEYFGISRQSPERELFKMEQDKLIVADKKK